MENPLQDFEFLDLSNINDSDRHQLQSVLYARDPNGRYPELPWCGSIQQQRVEPPPPPLDWMPQQYGENENLVNGGGLEDLEDELAQDETPVDSEVVSESGNVYSVPQQPPLSASSTVPVYPPFSNVYVNQMTANVSVHGFMPSGMPPPHPGYSHGHPPPPHHMYQPNVPVHTEPSNNSANPRKRNKSGNNSNIQNGRRVETQQVEVQQQPPPMHPTNFPPFHQGAAYYPTPPFYYGPPQHAPGSYLSTQLPLYHPHHAQSVYPPNYAHQMYATPPPLPHHAPPHGHPIPVSHVEESQQVHHNIPSNHHVEQTQKQHNQHIKRGSPPVDVQPVVVQTQQHTHNGEQRSVEEDSWQGQNGEEEYEDEEEVDVDDSHHHQEENVVEEGSYEDGEPDEVYAEEEAVPHETEAVIIESQQQQTKNDVENNIFPEKDESSSSTLTSPEDKTSPLSNHNDEIVEPSSPSSQQQSPSSAVTATPPTTVTIVESSLESNKQQTPTTAAFVEKTPTSWASLFKKPSSSSGGIGGTSSPASSNVDYTSGGKSLSGTQQQQKPCARVEPLTNHYQSSTSTQQSSATNVNNSNRYGGNNNSGPSYDQRKSSGQTNSNISNDAASQTLGKLLLSTKLDHKGLSLQPRGLINRSNYCYINATLQALIACPPFYNLLRSINKNRPYSRNNSHHHHNHTNTESHTPIFNAMLQLANEFQYLQLTPNMRREQKPRDEMDIKTGTPFEPTYVYQILSTIKSESSFNVEGRQEDAEEFLTFLLNGLNDEMLELLKSQSPKFEKDVQSDAKSVNPKSDGGRNKLTNGDLNGDYNGDADDGDWKEVTKDSKNKGTVVRRHTSVSDKTPVSEIFRGHLRTKVVRVSDSSITENIQPFFTLPLDIEKVNSVKEALEQLVIKEGLEGVTSSKTNQETEAYQTVTLEDLPNVLLLHLKCFDYKLHTCYKIQKPIEFNVTLTLESRLLSSNGKNKKMGGGPFVSKNKQYKLFAVVYHDGKEASKGHYLTDVFHVGYSGWIRYDDSNVRFVPENEVLKPKPPRVPYILYYRRADTIVSKNISSMS